MPHTTQKHDHQYFSLFVYLPSFLVLLQVGPINQRKTSEANCSSFLQATCHPYYTTNSVKATKRAQRLTSTKQQTPIGLILSLSTNRLIRKRMPPLPFYASSPTPVPNHWYTYIH